MPRKTLIINGSPHENGHTAALLNELRKTLDGDVIEVSALRASIAPCIDCRKCWDTAQCALQDEMSLIYADDFDNVVLASPVYFGTLPGSILGLASRLQARRGSHMARAKAEIRPKKAGLILTAGGRGDCHMALHHARCMFKMMGAQGFENRAAASLSTDTLPASEDKKALAAARALGAWLSED